VAVSLLFFVAITVAINFSIPLPFASASPSEGACGSCNYTAIFIESLAYVPLNASLAQVRLVAAVTVGLQFLNAHASASPADWVVTCDDVLLSMTIAGDERWGHACGYVPSSPPPHPPAGTCRAPLSAHCSSFPSYHNGETISSSCSFQSSTTHQRLWSFWLHDPPPLNSRANISLRMNCVSSHGNIRVESLPSIHTLLPPPPRPLAPAPAFPPMITGQFDTMQPPSLPQLAHAHAHPLFPQAFDYLLSFNESTPDGRYELLGSDLYALISRHSLASPDEKQWESHLEYGDIQVCRRCRRRRLPRCCSSSCRRCTKAGSS
jgi:hypothetical protein